LCRLADARQLGSVDLDGGGGEPLEELMCPDRRFERGPDREPRQKGLRKGDQPGAVAGGLFDDRTRLFDAPVGIEKHRRDVSSGHLVGGIVDHGPGLGLEFPRCSFR
jgi:hypothetical protein